MELPSCPCPSPGLVIIDSELTAVGGGGRRCHFTNKLFTLRQGEWVEEYPPMNTARSDPAVVSTYHGDYIIVIGGWSEESSTTSTAELLCVKSRRWQELINLPQPLSDPSATVCGDQLNIIGSGKNGYSCSLQALASSDRPVTSPVTLSWKPLPPLPVNGSTAATLCGQLVIIGGRQDLSSVNSIHQLVGEEWVEIGSMTRGRYHCLVASQSPDRIIIVGRFGPESYAQYTVEECAVV